MKIIESILICLMVVSFPTKSIAEIKTYRLDPLMTHQTIDGFGASDAWSMRCVGLMPDSVQTKVADCLFSTENDEYGKPEGIGLSMWRFNIGAGSVEQGDSSYINPSTRTECFMNEDGAYDWTKQLGQRRFLQLAKERGVSYLLGFLNSPPVYFTKNGLATNTGRGGTYNLKEDRYEDFAKFISDVIVGLKENYGITLDYVSPFNEPDAHWNWLGPKQEGTPATNREIARASRLLDQKLSDRNINTKIIIPESSDYRCMLATHIADWQQGYEIRSFFSPDSTDTYVGNLHNLPRLMAGHSYWTNTPVDTMKLIRMELRDTLKKYGVDFWQSEVCIMSNDEEIGGGHGFDRTMKTALYVARLMHHDLVYADARSWQWWRAIGGNYKDGLLFQYRDRMTGTDTIVDSKLLWTFGNFSRFIRPGAERIEISEIDSAGNRIPDSVTDPYGLMLSAYKNYDGSLVLVAINYSDEEKDFWIVHPSDKPHFSIAYITSDKDGESLAPVSVESAGTITVPARCVMTFIERNEVSDVIPKYGNKQ